MLTLFFLSRLNCVSREFEATLLASRSVSDICLSLLSTFPNIERTTLPHPDSSVLTHVGGLSVIWWIAPISFNAYRCLFSTFFSTFSSLASSLVVSTNLSLTASRMSTSLVLSCGTELRGPILPTRLAALSPVQTPRSLRARDVTRLPDTTRSLPGPCWPNEVVVEVLPHLVQAPEILVSPVHSVCAQRLYGDPLTHTCNGIGPPKHSRRNYHVQP